MPRQFDDFLCTEHSPSVKDANCHKGIKRARKDGFSDCIENACRYSRNFIIFYKLQLRLASSQQIRTFKSACFMR